MALMTDIDRAQLWTEMMAQLSREGMELAVIKQQGRDVINALDGYFNTTAADANLAIPQPQRGLLSTTVKARLAVAVLERRYLKGA